MPKKKKVKLVNRLPKVTNSPKGTVVLTELEESYLPIPNPIKSSLKVSGRTCVAEGQTIQEAITNLKPEIAKGTGILTLEKGSVRKEKIIPHNLVMRLFGKNVSRLNQEIALKNVMLMFEKNLFE